jgi:hypothetical protein
MMRGCPLPVDWLDYLDGDQPDLKHHLDECLTCQAFVASLRSQPITSIDHAWAKPFIGQVDAVWHEDRPATPAPAEFWLSAADYSLPSTFNTFNSELEQGFAYQGTDRLLVLVVSHPTEDHSMQWLDVVPVMSDVERATETDVLFEADENSLGAPWRALFAHQCKVAREQLDTRVGSLWEAGQMVLTAAFNGSLDDRRWGTPLQPPYDPRAFLGNEFDEAMLRLRTPWLMVCEAANDSGEQVWGPHLVPPPPESSEEDEPRGMLFTLKPLEAPPRHLALAAASTSAHATELWGLESADFTLVGKLHVDFSNGLLLFAVMSVQLKHATRLRLHVVAYDKTQESDVVIAEPDIDITLAEQVPIEAVKDIKAEVLP